MSTLHFHPTVAVVDANVCIGQEPGGEQGVVVPAGLAGLLREMDDRGVRRAVVHHAHAATHSARVGWRLLEELLDGEDRDPAGRLIAQTCVLPTEDDLALLWELDEVDRLRCARLACVAGEKLPFLPAIYGSMLDFLESRQIPLWIDLWDVEVRDLLDTLQRFPHLQVVLTGAHYLHYLVVEPLLRALPQVRLELSRYEAFGQIERLVEQFGAERLTYGSGYPGYAMGPVLFYLHHCPTLTPEQLQLICAGNVERLLDARRGAAGGAR